MERVRSKLQFRVWRATGKLRISQIPIARPSPDSFCYFRVGTNQSSEVGGNPLRHSPLTESSALQLDPVANLQFAHRHVAALERPHLVVRGDPHLEAGARAEPEDLLATSWDHAAGPMELAV